MTEHRHSTLAGILALLVVRTALGEVPILHEPLPASPGVASRPSGTGDPAPEDGTEILDLGDADELSDPPVAPTSAEDPRIAPPGGITLDDRTAVEPSLRYYAVFDPSVAPFKRGYVRDRVGSDGELTVAHAKLEPVRTTSLPAGVPSRRFWGSLLVELDANEPVPIPSVAPEAALIRLEAAPPRDVQVLRDGAGNWFVVASEGGRVRLNMLLEAPLSYFAGPLPETYPLGRLGLPSLMSAPLFETTGREVFEQIRATAGLPDGPLEEQDFAAVLEAMVRYFRTFESGELGETSADPLARFRAVALQRRGVCRHRAYAFVVTAQAIGLRARYVANEAHAFVEVLVPAGRPFWRRIDLGGAAAQVDVRGRAHQSWAATRDDMFPEPRGYRSATSSLGIHARDASAGPGQWTRRLRRWFGLRGSDPDSQGGSPDIRVSIQPAEAHVFRGEPVSVHGTATSRRGLGVAAILLRVELEGPYGAARRVSLGVTRTGTDGNYELHAPVPTDLPPGRYRFVVTPVL